ncbi:hypothetical protein ACP275_10G076600 [Erythranthe tilingii]
MGIEEKSNPKSRAERRKEARVSKNKRKFDSWVQHGQSKKKSKPGKKTPKENGTKILTEAEKSKTKGWGQPRKIGNNRNENDSIRNKGFGKAPKTKFFDLLEMEMGGKLVPSAEEDLNVERRLAKKLKLKKGNLGAANDGMDMLLEGVPDIDELGEFEKVGKKSGKSKKIFSMNEDSEGDISVDDEDGEFDFLGSSDEESDLLASGEEEDEEGEEESDLLAGSEEEDDEGEESDFLGSSDEEDEESDRPVSGKGKKRKTKFEEDVLETEADVALERKLAKKLKVKAGKVQGDDDDDISMLDGNNENDLKTSSSELAVKSSSNAGLGKYVPPHLRSHSGDESAEYAQVRKRVRGLLNKLSETNVESITAEISTLLQSVGRTAGSQIVSEEVVASCSGGPRGNEQYAAVFASFVAGMACSVGIDFGAKLLERLAKCFEEEYLKDDNLSLRNVTLLLSYLYVFGICSSELIYDFLIMLGKRLTEVDVSTVLTVLQCCGIKLRGDDPVGMKNFISSVQSRVNELKASSEDGKSNINNKRMEFMLETICDIKNNKKRSKEDTVQHTRIKKWLQKLRVDDILIRGLKWSKLLDPSKKGQWWLSGENASKRENVEEVANTIDKEILETKKMLQLAASQRMNTDARRAIFCVIMSGDDYVDAFEKLLRLDLPGKQDREIIRVLVECCLQEKVFNKYYCALASKLCSYDKNHKFTLQYCLWDHFKELDSMPLIRSMHLSKFIAEMVASFSISLAVLKAVDLNNVLSLSSKKIMHFRMLFEAIFEFPDKVVWNIFTRLAITPENESVKSGIEFFIRKYVVCGKKPLEIMFKIARRALDNVEGVIL